MVNIRLKTMMMREEVSGLRLSQKVGIGPTRMSYIINNWVVPTKEEKAAIEKELKCSGLFPEASENKQTKNAKERKKV